MLGFKRDLMAKAQTFVFDMIPQHLEDIAKFPSEVLRIQRLYASSKGLASIPRETIQELREFSSRVVYLETGGRNPYFIIKEAG